MQIEIEHALMRRGERGVFADLRARIVGIRSGGRGAGILSGARMRLGARLCAASGKVSAGSIGIAVASATSSAPAAEKPPMAPGATRLPPKNPNAFSIAATVHEREDRGRGRKSSRARDSEMAAMREIDRRGSRADHGECAHRHARVGHADKRRDADQENRDRDPVAQAPDQRRERCERCDVIDEPDPAREPDREREGRQRVGTGERREPGAVEEPCARQFADDDSGKEERRPTREGALGENGGAGGKGRCRDQQARNETGQDGVLLVVRERAPLRSRRAERAPASRPESAARACPRCSAG